MVVRRDFVFLHMPKTEGGTIKAVLPDGYARPGPQPHPHPGWRAIPPRAAKLPVLCHVRNPWDCYLSWYSWSLPLTDNKSRLWAAAFGDQPDFATFVRRACSGDLDHDRPSWRAAATTSTPRAGWTSPAASARTA